MPFFDYASVAREAGIPDDKLAELVRIMRQEFPGDEMMTDLHVLRACMVIQEGRTTIDAILSRHTAETPSAV